MGELGGNDVTMSVAQWRSQDLEVGGIDGLADGSPPPGSRGRAPGGGFVGRTAEPPPPGSSQHITFFGCRTMHNFA